jgi:membrane protease YdiL (CAAX protease family)
LPGAGQFCQGETAKGILYSGGTLSLTGWAIYASYHKEPGAINAPLAYAQQLYVFSLYSAYRDYRVRNSLTGGPLRFDPASDGKLASAPFRWEQLSSPWVFGSMLAGAGLNYVVARQADNPGFHSFRRMTYLGSSFNKDTGSAVYSAYWIPLSLGAGVSEETLFRGLLQSGFEAEWGRVPGWLVGSGLFGLAHLANPGESGSWGNVGFATLAGLYLGWRYQQTDYHLSQSIAAHFWFDLAAGATLFLADPKDNPLGARIEFGF